jgi:hypothetical protein
MKIYLQHEHKQKLMKNFSKIYNLNNKINQNKYIRIYTKNGIFNLVNHDVIELLPVEKNVYQIENFCDDSVVVDESYFKLGNKNSNIPLFYKSVNVEEYIYTKYFNITKDNIKIVKQINLVFEMNKNKDNQITFYYISGKNIDIKNNDDKILLSKFLNNLF